MTGVQSVQNESVTSFLQCHLRRQNYEDVKRNNKELISHYLIVHGQPSPMVMGWIQVCNEKYRAFINAKDSTKQIKGLANGTLEVIPATGLTPLACAVLMQREDIVRAFCLSPHLDPLLPDDRGWTVLQHAIAAGNSRILKLVEDVTDRAQLASTCAEGEKENESTDLTAKTVKIFANQMFPFLRCLLLERPNLGDGDPAVLYQVKPGEVIPWTQKRFEDETGVRFYDGLWAGPNALFFNWQRTPNIENSCPQFQEEAWRVYSRKHPPLILSTFEGAGLGVISQKKLPRGKIVCTYGSELTSVQTVEQDLKLVHTNLFGSGANIRSFGSMINDGLPNVISLPMEKDGVVVDTIYSSQDLEAQDQLFLDYGPFNEVKWGPRREMQLERVYQIFQTKDSLDEYWKSLEREREVLSQLKNTTTQHAEDLFAYQCRRSVLVYLFSTPSLLTGMMVEERVSPNLVENLLKNPAFIKCIELNREKGPLIIEFYMKAISLIRCFEKTLPPHVKDALRRDTAVQIQSNLRAGILAFELMLNDYSESLTAQALMQKFQKIYEGAEGFFCIHENRGDQQQSLQCYQALEKKDRNSIISLFREKGFPFFGESDIRVEVGQYETIWGQNLSD